MLNKKWMLSLFAVSSLALTACAANDTDDDVDDTTPPVENQEDQKDQDAQDDQENQEETTGDQYTNLKIQGEEAFDTFMDEYPDAKVSKVQLDKDMNDFVYKVEGFEGNNEYELKINPTDGSILNKEEETDDDQDEMEISREQVEKVADLVEKSLSDAGEGATLDEWTLDEDDGLVKLEVEIDIDGSDDIEHTYDIETGELLEKDD
ncbi:MAG: PepSY domain-containing protein [Atopostipes suicloacalis]|nr:PepSY domain-containing protein [Atopostipes suicloacalis]MDN6731757.1 PepSY domain-containing protein [Atopostipes suicloacalis]